MRIDKLLARSGFCLSSLSRCAFYASPASLWAALFSPHDRMWDLGRFSSEVYREIENASRCECEVTDFTAPRFYDDTHSWTCGNLSEFFYFYNAISLLLKRGFELMKMMLALILPFRYQYTFSTGGYDYRCNLASRMDHLFVTSICTNKICTYII